MIRKVIIPNNNIFKLCQNLSCTFKRQNYLFLNKYYHMNIYNVNLKRYFSNLKQRDDDEAQLKDYQFYIRQGVDYYKQKKIDQAIQSFERSLLLNPNNQLVYINLAKIYFIQYKVQQMIESLTKAVKINPRSPSITNLIYQLVLMMISKIQNKDQSQIKQSPNNVKSKSQLAKYFTLHSKPEKAIAILQQDNSINPSISNTFRGVVLFMQKNFSQAIKVFQKEIQLNPNDMISTLFLAFIFFQKGKFNKAKIYFMRILQKIPNQPHSLGLLGQILFSQKKYNQSIQLLKKALSIQSMYKERFEKQLKLVYIKQKQYQNVQNKNLQILKTNPNDLQALKSLCCHYFEHYDYDKTTNQLMKIHKIEKLINQQKISIQELDQLMQKYLGIPQSKIKVQLPTKNLSLTNIKFFLVSNKIFNLFNKLLLNLTLQYINNKDKIRLIKNLQEQIKKIFQKSIKIIFKKYDVQQKKHEFLSFTKQIVRIQKRLYHLQKDQKKQDQISIQSIVISANPIKKNKKKSQIIKNNLFQDE